MGGVGGGLRNVLALGAVALVAVGAATAARLDAGDFGDAPDGRATGYFAGNSTGSFPSLASHDGAHAHDTGTVRFGASASAEADAKLVNADASDDGVAVTLRSCATSTAYVAIAIAPGTTGTAYVNLLFDWNRNGAWGAQDSCAAEWAARNVAIDLSKQTSPTQIYAIPFRAGRQVENLWYRALLSYEQRWTNETGAGAIARGEVEDSRIGNAVSKRARRRGKPVLLSATCTTSPLVVPRGGTGRIFLARTPGSRQIEKVALAPGVVPKNRSRTLTVRGGSVIYKSTGGPSRTVDEVVRIALIYENVGTLIVPCMVRVVQPPLATAEPARTNCTLTGPVSNFAPFEGGRKLRGKLRLGGAPRTWARQCFGPDAGVGAVEISGFGGAGAIGAVVHLGDPTRRVPPPTWGCAVVGPDTVRCAGTPLRTNTDYYFDVAFGGGLPDSVSQVHVVLLTTSGEPLGSVESGRS